MPRQKVPAEACRELSAPHGSAAGHRGLWIHWRSPLAFGLGRTALPPPFPAPKIQDNRLVVRFSPALASAEVATFNDQLGAFLHFEYLRGREARSGNDTSRILLTAFDTPKGPSYRIFIVSDNDLLTAVPQLARLKGNNLITHYELTTWTEKDFAYYRQQSHMFDVAYGVPTEQKLESLSSFRLLPALARFLVFKSQTDNRVLERSDAAPRPLTTETGHAACLRHSRRRGFLRAPARLFSRCRRHGERLHGC